MVLFIKDPEVDALAQQLASLKRTTKTEAVRQALRGESDREKDRLDLVAQSLAFARSLRERAGPNATPVSQAVRDELYGNPRCSSTPPPWSRSLPASPTPPPSSRAFSALASG